MSQPIRRVVIAGGGSAGWLIASRLAAVYGRAEVGGIEVLLVESPNIPTIGVGEGTWPTMRRTLRKIGLSEAEFLRGCDGAFKQGTKFVDWAESGSGKAYYHPFSPPLGHGHINLASHWEQEAARTGRSFAATVGYQQAVCAAGMAPKMLSTPEYEGYVNYAYHLDAGKFAGLLREHSVRHLGVRHVRDDIVAVRRAPYGSIAELCTMHSGALAGDLFIDCTGFKALLLGETLGVSFVPRHDVLFIDNALAMQVPYASSDAPVACQTLSVARDAGWIWDIGLPGRRGIGYVYSGAHSSHDHAERTLRDYVGAMGKDVSARQIPIRTGHRRVFWEQNCVAVGLSAGFLEPLEASALMLIELAADLIADDLPSCREVMPHHARRFNEAFSRHWERVIEFLKLHYVLSRREDSAFWRDNRDRASIPDGLQERLESWRYQAPSAADFPHQSEVFSWPSYQFVLYGSGYRTDFSPYYPKAGEVEEARRLFAGRDRAVARARAELPAHRALLNALKSGAFPAG